MSERKQLIRALKHLELRYLTQQQQIDNHADHLLAWYHQHRTKLFFLLATLGLGATYWVQKFEKHPKSVLTRLKPLGLGVLWLADFFALNPKILRQYLTYRGKLGEI